MGAPSHPLSHQSQLLSQTQSFRTDANGAGTVTFPSPPQGFTWTGTLNCATATTAAVFVATVGAVSWGEWGGNSVYGPVQVLGAGSQQLKVSVTGLAASTTYVLQWNGSSDPSELVAASWPDANSTALTASISGTVQVSSGVDLLYSDSPPGNQLTTTGYTFTGTALNNYQALGVVLLLGGAYGTAVGVTFQNLRTNQVVNVQNAVNSTNYVFQAQVFCTAGDSISITIYTTLGSIGPVYTDFVNLYGYTVSPLTGVQNVPNVSLDVVEYGGLQFAYTNAVTTTAPGVSLLGFPATGTAWRLHSWTINTLPTAGVVKLWGGSGAQGTFGAMFTNAVGTQYLGGILTTQPVYVYGPGLAPATVGACLFYDVVELPSIN